MPDTPPHRLDLPLALLAAGTVFVAGLLFATGAVAGPDELTFLAHGRRLLAGQVPYRDFFEFTTPGFIWLSTLVFALAGDEVLAVARTLQAALLALAAYQLHRMARTLGIGPWLAMLPGLALGLALFRFYPYWSYHWVVIPVLLATTQALWRGVTGDALKPWAWAGAGAAACALLIQSDGVLAIVLVGTAALADGWLGPAGLRRTGQRLGAATLGALVPAGAAALALAAQGALIPAYGNIVTWMLSHYRQSGGVNDVKFATDAGMFLPLGAAWRGMATFYLRAFHGLVLLTIVPLTAGLATTWLAGLATARLRGAAPWSQADARLGVLALLTTGSALLALVGRADAYHVAMYATPALLAATWLASRWAAACQASALAFVRPLPAWALAAFVLGGGTWAVQAMRAPDSPWAGFRGADAAHREAPLVRWLRTHAQPGDRVLGYPAGAALYVYALPASGRYTLILPGIGYMDDAEFENIRHALAVDQPRFVVFLPFAADAITRPDYFRQLVASGYTLKARIPEPMPGIQAAAEVYERNAPIQRP